MPPIKQPNIALDQTHLFDALILGAGPAGLSTVLALCRVNRTAAVFSDPSPTSYRNAQAHRAHTILSRDHTPPAEIRRAGREDIEKYGTVRFVERAIVAARKGKSEEDAMVFEVEDQEGQVWRGKKIVLAMGVKDILPTEIEGYDECWGRDIYQCLFCDGIERSHLPAGLLGFDSPTALHAVDAIAQMGCPSITIFSNGPLEVKDNGTANALAIAKAKGAKVDQRRIQKLTHLNDDQGLQIVFADDSSETVGFLAHRPATEVVAPALVGALGLQILDDGMGGTMLKRGEPFGESSVKGCFVAGDAGTLMRQVTIAMVQGVMAGLGVHQQICAEENGRLIRADGSTVEEGL